MKKIYFLLVFLGLYLFSSFIYAADSFQLITNSDNGDYIGQGKNWIFSDKADSIKNINAADKTLTFGIENFSLGLMNFSFGSPNNLQKGLYYPAKRYPFRGDFNGIDISGNGKGCNEILGGFYVHEYDIDSLGKLEKAAIDFVQYCEKGSKGLYGSFRYNSSIALSCTKSNCDGAKKVLNIENIYTNDNSIDNDNDNGNNDNINDGNENLNLPQELTSKIFKIQAYSYDNIFDVYVLEQYGSAVLVGKNLLITNAHVITDTDGVPSFDYEVCQTVSVNENSKCFSVAKLISYDAKNDLALLEIKNIPNDFPEQVVLGSNNISIGSKINILGYPANGGNTISLTQGTIAGFQNGLYKTDANLDEGNSGGGAFDKNENFIGIPTFVVNGQTTMGYIIPIAKISSFMKGDTGIKKTKAINPKFEKYIKNIYSIKDKGVISNDIFSSTNFKDIGFTIISAIEKKANNLYNYSFEDADGNYMSMKTVLFSKNIDMQKYIDANFDATEKPKKTSKKIGNIQRSIVSYEYDDNYVGYFYVQTNSDSNTFLEYELIVDKSSTDIIKKALTFLESTNLKSYNKSPQKIDIPGIKLSTKRDIAIFKEILNDGLKLFIISKNKNFTVTVSSSILPSTASNDNLKDGANFLKTVWSEAGYTVTLENLKNLYILHTYDGEKTYGVTALGFVDYNGNKRLISMSSDFKSKSTEKDAISLFQKILPSKN